MRFIQLLGIILLAVAVPAWAAGFVAKPGDAQGASNSAPPANAGESTAANTASQASRLVRISDIRVAQDRGGVNVEISGDGALIARASKLSHPDRIVLDITDSVLVGHSRQITVNSGDIKDVRAAHYQDAPSTTRVVVDMAAMHDFQLVPGGKTLLLKLRSTSSASHLNTTPTPSVAQRSDTAPVPPEVKLAAPAASPAQMASKSGGPTSPHVAPSGQTRPPGVAGKDSNAAGAISVTLLGPPPKNPASSMANQDAAGQTKSDKAAAHFAQAALVNPKQPPLSARASLAADSGLTNAALLQQQQAQPIAATTSSSCANGHYSGSPLNLDLKDLDIKDFFRLVHELSGLNVVLDPGVKGIVTIDVTDIPWDQALAIVLRNNGLECELEGNVLRIATLETLRAEADARRAQQEALAMAVPRQNATRYLSYAHSKDVAVILKKFLSPRGDIVADDRSNAVIIEDIPSVFPKIDELLRALDRKTPEVEIEARVVSATRTFASNIGTQLGFGWGNGVSAAGGGTGATDPISQTFPAGVTPPWITIPNQAGQIPLFSNLGAVSPTSGISLINSTSTYRLDFTLSMAESRGLVKILSRPRVVTQNNISTTIRQGQQIPVVTLAQLGGPPTVTYVAAFLRLTVTPQITNENTIFLLLDIENTTPDFTHVTSSQLNPALDTQQATTQVLVSDGQTVVIGGVIQTVNSLTVNQVPLLGNIPILGNLFKNTVINTSTAELLFFITPKIIQT